MYADRYERSKPNPVSLTAAIGINAALVAALLLSVPDVIEDKGGITQIFDVPDILPPPPVPEKPKPATKAAHDPLVVTPIPDVKPPVTVDNMLIGTTDILPLPFEPVVPKGEPAMPTPLIPAPVLTEAAPVNGVVFQPDYPASERRAGTQGAVTVRVLVGTDGRVKAIELVRTVSDAFFDATRRQALARWRFKPATRDGIPYESWRMMTVRFVLEG